jgi:hypothetical protein
VWGGDLVRVELNGKFTEDALDGLLVVLGVHAQDGVVVLDPWLDV